MFVRVHFLCVVCGVRAPRKMPQLWWRACCKAKASSQQTGGVSCLNRARLQTCRLCKGSVVSAITPNPAVKRDCAKARSPLLLRYALDH